MNHTKYEEKGYLYEDFRLFYLDEYVTKEVEYHYHNFDKILILFKGKVEYTIEGKSYDLLPNDIVLVPRGESHKAKMESTYNRIVIYLSSDYLNDKKETNASLRDCFLQAEKNHSHVIRSKPKHSDSLTRAVSALKESFTNKTSASFTSLYQETLLLQFLIALNEKVNTDSFRPVDVSNCNKKIVEIIHYINQHLTEDLTIDELANHFFISKYYMMRQFKDATGYTIGNYINQKRLFLARELLKQGVPVTEACFDSGFKDYSTFSRAYKQMFGETASKINNK